MMDDVILSLYSIPEDAWGIIASYLSVFDVSAIALSISPITRRTRWKAIESQKVRKVFAIPKYQRRTEENAIELQTSKTANDAIVTRVVLREGLSFQVWGGKQIASRLASLNNQSRSVARMLGLVVVEYAR